MTPCILWTGYTRDDGYGYNAGRPAHRVAYERANGPIASGLDVDHLCFERRCVNPDHLRLLDPTANRRLQRSASKPVCSKGHPYDEMTTYRRPSGQRDCRVCGRERQAMHRRRLAA